ncbi:MAG: protein kinase, partial [Chloroflexi bacterium]|nr:protein kinase [Chloroflexota bacterium]
MREMIGRYQVLNRVAAGGQATVYRAHDTKLGRVVALKVLHPHLAGDEQFLERFLREAKLAGTLTHPNAVVIYEVSEDRGQHFIAMEYLPSSMHDLLRERAPLPMDQAVRLMRPIALALGSAHRRGIVHRDLKPQNILLTADGSPKITDFGIAHAAGFATMTATGLVMGTPQYMAPEQARGDRVDARTDVYSLAIIFYQCLTGHVPFEGRTPEQVVRHHLLRQETPFDALDRIPVSAVLADARDLLRRAVSVDPSVRPATATVFAEELTALQPPTSRARAVATDHSVGRDVTQGRTLGRSITPDAARAQLSEGGVRTPRWPHRPDGPGLARRPPGRFPITTAFVQAEERRNGSRGDESVTQQASEGMSRDEQRAAERTTLQRAESRHRAIDRETPGRETLAQHQIRAAQEVVGQYEQRIGAERQRREEAENERERTQERVR